MITYALNDIRKQRGDFCLSVESLEIRQGEVYALMGENGSGKTTLLNLLAFMDCPDSGSLVFNGQATEAEGLAGLLPERRRIACLLQGPYLFNVSVFENVAYGLRIRGVSKSETASRVASILERLGLSVLSGRNAHALSGGEAQRVAMARTLVLDSDAYLLDEPTANVDQRNVREFEDRIREMVEEKKATVVLSTHSKEQAERMARNIILMKEGSVS